jgi:hypothetical protein
MREERRGGEKRKREVEERSGGEKGRSEEEERSGGIIGTSFVPRHKRCRACAKTQEMPSTLTPFHHIFCYAIFKSFLVRVGING